MSSHSSSLALIALLFLGGCSSPQEPEPEVVTPPPPEETAEEEDDGMAIEGLHGTLRRDEVDPVLNRAAADFQECYIEAYMDHPYLDGEISLEFSVSPEGSVSSVWTTSATLGSRDVEECILSSARRLRFPRPHGGDAEFDYGPLVMSSDDGHPFERWTIDRLEEEQATAIQEAYAGCTNGHSGYRAVLYIGPGGAIRSIGAVAPSADAQEGARCLERELRALEFPDPGSGNIAKMTLEL